ncbi:helix-turn-helix domain-containing protein, partial [Acidithiobacillus sp. IBUN Pt1247-S3]|uniref:helix-turn-helix domain-containing protein n=1 Tax=Acidithiobacillus sp. IBUN Pt1247-S3 TaxID=3166642 RepID=UPI0034E4090B
AVGTFRQSRYAARIALPVPTMRRNAKVIAEIGFTLLFAVGRVVRYSCDSGHSSARSLALCIWSHLPPTLVSMKKVSERIRQLREEQGCSVRKLAALAEISPSALSQIEAGLNSPSVATLDKICGALGVPIVAIFEGEEPESMPLLMRAGERRKVYSAGSRATLEPLARGLPRKTMRPLLMVLEPGGECGEHPYSSAQGEEFAFLVQGMATFEQMDKLTELRAGDAIYYDPRQAHNWHNPNQAPATLLIVVAQ